MKIELMFFTFDLERLVLVNLVFDAIRIGITFLFVSSVVNIIIKVKWCNVVN